MTVEALVAGLYGVALLAVTVGLLVLHGVSWWWERYVEGLAALRQLDQQRAISSAAWRPPATAGQGSTPPACSCVVCLADRVAVEHRLPRPLSRRAVLLVLGAYMDQAEA